MCRNSYTPRRPADGECSLHEEYGGGSLREFLARIIEGDSRRGARVDLSIDLRPKALSLDGSPPEFIVTHYEVQKLQWNSKGVGGRESKKTAGVTLRSAPLRKHKLDRSGALMVGRRRRVHANHRSDLQSNSWSRMRLLESARLSPT